MTSCPFCIIYLIVLRMVHKFHLLSLFRDKLFWWTGSIELLFGDSHSYNSISLCLLCYKTYNIYVTYNTHVTIYVIDSPSQLLNSDQHFMCKGLYRKGWSTDGPWFTMLWLNDFLTSWRCRSDTHSVDTILWILNFNLFLA